MNAYEIVVAEDANWKLLCKTPGFKYVPDTMRYRYGSCARRPLEDWLLDELDYFKTNYPDFDIFTLGSSCVFGEKFINYLTICEFSIDSEIAFENLKKALRESDQAIRKKFHAMWKWDIAARRGNDILFMVGHMDFAYFLQHRKEFQGDAHNRYMKSFTTPSTLIRSTDYKVLHRGEIVEFDESKLSQEDRFVFDHYNEVKYETVRKM